MGQKVSYSIKGNDKWSEVSWFFDAYPDRLGELAVRFTEKDESVDFFQWTVGDLCEIYDHGIPKSRTEGLTVAEFMALRNTVADKMKDLSTFLENTVPPSTESQRKAQSGTLDMSVEEAILLTCRNFYDLHSLEDAQKLTIYEYMIARKSVYNERRMAYNMEMAADMAAARR